MIHRNVKHIILVSLYVLLFSILQSIFITNPTIHCYNSLHNFLRSYIFIVCYINSLIYHFLNIFFCTELTCRNPKTFFVLFVVSDYWLKICPLQTKNEKCLMLQTWCFVEQNWFLFLCCKHSNLVLKFFHLKFLIT